MIAATWLACLALVSPAPAGLAEVDASSFPTVRVFLPIADQRGPLPVSEDDLRAVARPVAQPPVRRLAIVVDSSGSTRDLLRSVARVVARLAVTLPKDTEFALIGAGSSPRALCPFTSSTPELLAAADRLEADGGSAWFDGVLLALGLSAGAPGRREILVFADGRNESSRATRDDLVALAKDLSLPILGVALGVASDGGALRGLADATGGRSWRAPTPEDLGAVAEAAIGELTGASCFEYVSPRPVSDGGLREVRWPESRSRALRFRAPWPLQDEVRAMVTATGPDGLALFAPVSLAKGDEVVARGVSNLAPLIAPAGSCALTVGLPGGVHGAPVALRPGRQPDFAFRIPSGLMVRAPRGPGREPPPVRVRLASSGEEVCSGFADELLALPGGEYSVAVGARGDVSYHRVRVEEGRTVVLEPAQSASFQLDATGPGGKPLSALIALLEPSTRKVRHTGRTGRPLFVPAGTYLVDYDLPHSDAPLLVTLREGERIAKALGAFGRLRVLCRGTPDMPPVPLFLRPKDGKRTFPLAGSDPVDLQPGAYVLTVSCVPPFSVDDLEIVPGEEKVLEFNLFGKLVVKGPPASGFKLVTEDPGGRKEWVGAFPCAEPLFLRAGEYGLAPRLARPEDPFEKIVVRVGETTEAEVH